MLNQYTWGDFALFVLVVVTLYYLVVGFLYYRQELTDFLTRKGRGGAQLAGVGAASAASVPPSLVRTQSAFVVATPTATESKADVETPEVEDGAASNLPDGQEVAEVTGSLPDSTAAATGLDDGESAAVPMDSAGGAETETDTAAEYDEQRTEELDEVDTELAARARQLAAQMPVEETNGEEEGVIEKNNNEIVDIETISTFSHVEAETAYEHGSSTTGDLLYEFQEPIGSTADVLPAAEQLFSATSVVDFIAQARAGNRPAGPVALNETSLATLIADKVSASNQELNALFGEDES
ncbi:hypothetical protein ACFST9_14245 [Hymenobacter monticola]|uniref:Conjugal transfer protein TraD n=1 Tax=Hymenobacter monticola TaxID=1705399 RepID=A0ABY4BC49_9BACT|nr:hypothetical protein [Hymenobacter monticola]UOE36724.1 hypothetical protein MTP16_24875 [Hymenobacter monticola]